MQVAFEELKEGLCTAPVLVYPEYTTRNVEAIFSVGEKVLMRREEQPKGPKIWARMWLGPYTIKAESHPRYHLESEGGKSTRNPAHVRRLRKSVERDVSTIVHDEGTKIRLKAPGPLC